MKRKHKKEIEERFFKFDINSEAFNYVTSYLDSVETEANTILWRIGLCLFYYDVSHYHIKIYKQPISYYFNTKNNNISYVAVNIITRHCFLFYNEAKNIRKG